MVDPRDQQTGTVDVPAAPVADNTGTTAIGTPTTVMTTTIGENAERTFTGTAGQKLTLHVSGEHVQWRCRAVGASSELDGDRSASTLFVDAATGFRDMFTLPDTGTYTVVVDPRISRPAP